MTKLFAHRGFTNNRKTIKENSKESLDEAVKMGFKAIEFDIWLSNQELVITHDDPEGKLDGIMRINDYFKYGNILEYWLDFKNMKEENVDEILSILKRAVQDNNINLDNLYFAPAIDDYNITKKLFYKIKTHFSSEATLVAFCCRAETMSSLKSFMTSNIISHVSINYNLITQDFIDQFGGNKIFAWTINDIATIKKLEIFGVRNFATDNIIPSLLTKSKIS